MPEDDMIQSALAALRKAAEFGATRRGSSNMPYYRPAFAEMVMHAVNHCLTTRSPLTWPAAGLSLNSLYLRWRQGSQYVIDHHPTADVERLQLVSVRKHRDIGLVIRPRPVELADSEQICWRPEFETFIESASPGEVFEKIGVRFTAADRTYVNSIMSKVMDQFICEFQADKLMIVRI